jgi:quercetin dioxygenase-like cupin family protein
VHRDSVNRAPDYKAIEAKNVAWTLLARRQASGCNLSIIVQRFEPGGDFEEHSHDLEQFFYITKGEIEMTIGDETEVYREGDFVSVGRNAVHSGRNVADVESELIAIDYWPADSEDRIGLD